MPRNVPRWIQLHCRFICCPEPCRHSTMFLGKGNGLQECNNLNRLIKLFPLGGAFRMQGLREEQHDPEVHDCATVEDDVGVTRCGPITHGIRRFSNHRYHRASDESSDENGVQRKKHIRQVTSGYHDKPVDASSKVQLPILPICP
ncbi:uncharacterized protein LOC105704350 [Orussus abietinus]|uniref:uncharacterized protein LOC105704350 n=1 Tax=Orussus abietinus TaxID=222816 RepID=UPI000626B417|nr:uncharacterized protein LOC105704350 [Orussus abietinus]